MKFTIKPNKRDNITTLTRKIGYRYLGKSEREEIVLVRPLERGGYPRFHLFLTINPETQELMFSLHLDQKRPVYKGAPAHAGDYEGGPVEREAERIKEILQK
ncbi:MAG: hypothetical protein ACKKMR_01110 [Candidatus Nealsonbacteria bacterium]